MAKQGNRRHRRRRGSHRSFINDENHGGETTKSISDKLKVVAAFGIAAEDKLMPLMMPSIAK